MNRSCWTPFLRPQAIALLAALLGVLAGNAGAQADRYPTRPIRLIVPFPPGGGNDILARAVGLRHGAHIPLRAALVSRAARKISTPPRRDSARKVPLPIVVMASREHFRHRVGGLFSRLDRSQTHD